MACTPTKHGGLDAQPGKDAAPTNAGLPIEAKGTTRCNPFRRYWGIGSGASQAQRQAFEAALRPLHNSLQRHGGPFLAGQQPSLADVVYYPFAKRFDLGARRFSGYDMHAALGGSVGGWLEAMGRRESARITTADDALLLAAYEEHKCLDFFDYTTYDVFQLHPQNIGALAEVE